ncbi:ImmA/IrrE family metallo-endopeptidase [Galactobacter valiniphilus]|uniref:ImmA/IrrE family metallo-endopeptidase n=2 Tax=Galactobacter valiniphilus TaxID=2676122 RepID=A0A399JD15_9MICC|nr:ImmA/IrrE family metallo-endopeptidase [Galactobacter valiniphilus]
MRWLSGVDHIVMPLTPGLHGLTDGRTFIATRIGLTKTEEGCAVMHEIVHVLLGHDGHQPQAIEREVREIAAQMLIPIGELEKELCWASSEGELADSLGVTVAVLRDRLNLPDARALMERAHFQEWT